MYTQEYQNKIRFEKSDGMKKYEKSALDLNERTLKPQLLADRGSQASIENMSKI